MAEHAQTVKVEVDAGEMFDKQSWSTYRRDIDEAGALGIGDGFGNLGVDVGGRPAVRMSLREDRLGQVVLDVVDAITNKKLGSVQVELFGLVAPRRGAKVKRDKRFPRGVATYGRSES